MAGNDKTFDPAIRTMILAERAEERLEALGEGIDRSLERLDKVEDKIGEQGTAISLTNNRIDNLVSDDNSGLNRIIDERIRISLEKRGMTSSQWISVLIAVLALGASIYFGFKSG